jgi:hypothetical protein
MDANDFRRIALSLEGAEESSHMGAPDFRVDGRVFATLASQLRADWFYSFNVVNRLRSVKKKARAFGCLPKALIALDRDEGGGLFRNSISTSISILVRPIVQHAWILWGCSRPFSSDGNILVENFVELVRPDRF